MDRIQNDRSSRRLRFYEKWLHTCATSSDAENCVQFAACDPALSPIHFAVLVAAYVRFLSSMEV